MSAPTSPANRQPRQGLIGKIIADRYLIRGQLGKGGMGSVFLAEHVVLKRPFAVKILHPELSQHEESVKRFVREAQTTASINHPNVCASTDFGKLPDGSFYMVMEYLEGKTLRSLNKLTPALPPPRAAHIIRQMASALAKAHDLGIVHRDLKPENIMLVEHEGEIDFVKIMDFGLASLIPKENEQERTRLTVAGIVYGTPVYMSPEQVRAEERIDGRADIYSLGAMLFEMLTGTTPFQGSNVTSLLAQHLTEPVCSIRERAPALDLPYAFDPIIQRAMAKRPADRFATTQEFIAAIDALGYTTHLLTPATGFSTSEFPAIADASSSQGSWRGAPATPPPAGSPLATQPMPAESPEKRLATLHKILIGLAILVVLMGVVAVMASTAKETPLPEDPALRVEALLDRSSSSLQTLRTELQSRDPVLHKAAELIEADEAAKASEMLLAVAPEHTEDAHFHYLLGRALFDDRKQSEAITHYDKAIVAQPDYFYDRHLLDDLIESLASSDEAVRDQVRPLFTNARLEEIVLLLGERAQTMKGHKNRKNLLEYLKNTQLFERLPPWRQAAIELRTASGCKAHSEAIKALTASNDPHALEPLRKLDATPRRGCGKHDKKDCYGCIRDDLATAITVLETKFPDATATEAAADDEPQEDIEAE